MRIAILGPLRVTEGGRALAVGGPRQRAVLAYLVLHAHQVIPSERLVDDLWGIPAPPGAANALQAAVSRLRKGLPAGRLVTTPHGYLLRLTPGEVDLADFEQASALGKRALAAGEVAEAVVHLRSALDLWRGPALADFQLEPFAQAEIARLEEAQLACREARIDADLAAGGGGELVAELRQLVTDHPLREKLTGQLMLALYRSGRQAEALEAYRRTRTLLADELGIDPSQELARIERAVLRQELTGPGVTGAGLTGPGLTGPGFTGPGFTGPEPAGPGLTPAVAASSRRPVTVVCIDVGPVPGRPSGEPWPPDPEMVHLVGERVRGLVGPALERHGGRMLPGSGQRLHGVFGAVVLHEDDAQRAAAAALDCRDALLAAADLGLACRIGIATAEALVSDAEPLGFVGEAAGTAQSLAAACAPGEVLISRQTYRLAAAALDTELLPGSGDGIRLLRAVRFGVRSLPVQLDAPVLGRAAELAALQAGCALAAEERTTVFVTVAGDAGLGKTRLVHEFSQCLGEGTTVITGRCLPYGDGVTFWPLREIVDQVTGGDLGAAGIQRVLRGEPDAAVVADRLCRAFGAGRAGTSDTAEIFWATRRLLEAVGRSGPLVVVLEDLHWAEPTFLGLVESIALQPGTAAVMIVAVTRPELLQERPDWLAAADRHTVVHLPPLTDDAAGALVEQLSRPVGLTGEARARVVRAAGGNPLFLEQLVAAAGEQPPGMATGEIPLPPTIQALLASRLDRLGPAEHEVLAAAAVVGKDFATVAVAALLPRQMGERLPWHLRTLASKALVQPVGSGARQQEQHSFRHILVQEATYRAIPKSARAVLHERLADWAEAQTGPGGAQQVELLGHHLAQATLYYRELAQSHRADSLASRACRYLEQAGTASLAVGDAAAAVRALERATALMPAVGPERVPVLTSLAAALFESGRLAEARTVLDDALALAARTGAQRAGAHARVQSLQFDLHLDPDGALDRVEQTLPEVRSAFLAKGDDLGLCEVWSLEAAVHWHRARSRAAEQAWQRAADAARAAGGDRQLTQSLWWLASAALWGPTPASEGIARCRSYLDQIGSTPTGRGVIYLHLAGLHAMSGDLPTARQLRASGSAILQEVGHALPMVLAEPAAFIATLGGDFASAERHLRGAFDALSGMGEQADLATCAAVLARVLALQGCDLDGIPVTGFGRWDEVVDLVEVSRTSAGGQDVSAQIIGNGALARRMIAAGDVAEAWRLAGEAVELAARTDLTNQCGDALLDQAHVLWAGGRRDEALASAGEARALYLSKENRLAVRWCDRLAVRIR